MMDKETPPKIDPEPLTVLDTQRIVAMFRKAAKIIEAEEEVIQKAKTPAPIQPKNTPYLLAIVIMIVVGIAGIALIVSLRPDTDFLIVSAAVFGFITPTTLALMTFLKAQEASTQARETHLAVNSRLDAFIKNAEAAALAQGKDEGRLQANERNDALRASQNMQPTNPPAAEGE